jgi:hypothetical protein
MLAAGSTRAREAPVELVERDDARAADPQPVHARRLDSDQTGAVQRVIRPSRWLRAGTVAGCLLLALGACSGDDDDGSGPDPTTEDPGPNDTSDAPVTIQGTARLDPAAGCIVLETENGRFALEFIDYALGDDGAPAIVATEDNRVLAHEGDTVVVTGRASTATNPCGAGFAVESLNSVIPAQP